MKAYYVNFGLDYSSALLSTKMVSTFAGLLIYDNVHTAVALQQSFLGLYYQVFLFMQNIVTL